MSDISELKRRVDANDPAAMYEYAELLRPTDPKEADKYIVFAAQLGFPNAVEKRGDMYLEAGDRENAAYCYKAGSRAGLLECSVKLAKLNLRLYEHVAIQELEELAQMGLPSACEALADYYKEKGNRKESAYWRSMLK